MSSTERTPLLTANEDDAVANSTPGREEIHNASPKANMVSFLGAISGCILLAALDSTIVTATFARIGSDMNQLQRASWIATSYMMSLTAFQPLYGKLSDIFGRKPCLLFAHFMFGVGCLVCATAHNLTGLIIARMASGIGGAGFMPLVTIAISDVVPLRKRGTWQGIVNLISTVGTASGAPLGGVIVDNFGWRWAFFVQVPICFLGFLVIWLAFPRNTNIEVVDRGDETTWVKLRRIDFLGSFLLIIVVFSLLLGLDKGSNESWTSPITYVSFIIAASATVIFVFVESNPSLAKEPVAPTRFFKNGNLVASYVTSLWLMSIGSSIVFLLALYAQVLKRKSASQASLYLLPIIIGLVIGHLTGGILTQKLGKFKNLAISAHVGIVFCAFISAITVYFQPPNWDLIALALSMGILSFFGGVSSTTRLVAIIASVSSSDHAAATALSFLFRTFGSLFGLSLCNAILQQVLRIMLARELSGLPYDIDELIRRVRESLTYIDSLDPAVQTIVRQSYSKGLLAAFGCGAVQSVLCLLSSLFIRDRSLESH